MLDEVDSVDSKPHNEAPVSTWHKLSIGDFKECEKAFRSAIIEIDCIWMLQSIIDKCGLNRRDWTRRYEKYIDSLFQMNSSTEQKIYNLLISSLETTQTQTDMAVKRQGCFYWQTTGCSVWTISNLTTLLCTSMRLKRPVNLTECPQK